MTDTELLKQVGIRIRHERQDLGFLPNELAMLARISVPYLRDIENGNCDMHLTVALRVVHALGKTLDWLVGDG